MNDTKRQARTAGVIYLILAILAPIGLFFSQLYVHGDAAATAARILASELQFRLGMTTALVCDVIFVCLGIALYRLFRATGHTQAMLMVALVVASGTAAFLNKLNHLAALIIVKAPDFLSAFSKPQLDSLMMLFLRLHDDAVYVIAMFWGLWLFPLGVLVMRSRFIPKILGILLIINGIAYVVTSLTFLLFPAAIDMVMRITAVPKFAGELPFLLWLLIKGAKDLPAPQPNPSI